MKRNMIAGLAAIMLLASCKNDKKILDSLADYINSSAGGITLWIIADPAE